MPSEVMRRVNCSMRVIRSKVLTANRVPGELMKINGREIILANLNHTDPPRPGLTFDGGRINDMSRAGVRASRSYTPRRWQEDEKEYYDDEWGNIWVRMIRGSVKGEIHQPVLADWGQLDDLKLPESQDPECYREMTHVFSGETGQFKVASLGGWIFNDARYLRRMEIYFMDMVMYPDELQRLHRKLAGVFEARIRAVRRAGADGIVIFEDLGTQNGLLFSPGMFREFFKSEYTRLFGIAHELGMKVLMHSCGYNWDILDDLMDAGVDCFQFDQPAIYDMPALAEKLRHRKVGLWSPLDIQKYLPTGDRELIEREADRMLGCFRGGLIAKNYPDLPGIGVHPEWDMWAYNRFAKGWTPSEMPAGAHA